MIINISESLPKGYRLQGKTNTYVIDRVLGQGTFGITYLARFKSTYKGYIGVGFIWAQVAIKEFFMRDLNFRDGSTGKINDVSQDSLIGRYRRAFMREARNLAGLRHRNIVKAYEVIEANNTVYIVMEYINGSSLDEHIKKNGHLSEEESLYSMKQICAAVKCIHDSHMLHLDIKPKNIMMDEDGSLYLIDFGLSRQYTEDGEPESSTTIGLGTPGYAPIEQGVMAGGVFRATLDIYAIGATLYKMLTGQTPPNAPPVSDSVINGDNIVPKQLKAAGISDGITEIVTKAMSPSSRGRYQSVDEILEALEIVAPSALSLSDETEETLAIPPTDIGSHSGNRFEQCHEFVDLGLSVKWATCNVGAIKPEEYGEYYAWGETSTKSNYTWENYRFRTSGNSWDNVKFSKYNTQSGRGTVDNRSTLELSDDVARQKWGGSWRMPTRTEFDELLSNCTWTWTTMNGVRGYKVTSKKSGYTDRSIFLPAAGYRRDSSLYSAGSYGYYWSGSLRPVLPNDAWYLYFDSVNLYTYSYRRYYGRSVRPVFP